MLTTELGLPNGGNLIKEFHMKSGRTIATSGVAGYGNIVLLKHNNI